LPSGAFTNAALRDKGFVVRLTLKGSWRLLMEYVYRVTHEIERPPEEDADWIEIGIYSTQEKAKEAQQQAS